MFPVDEPIERWEDLQDWRRLKSTIGPFPWNWLRIQEVDSTIRPWVIRRECLERVGLLDEAFVPTEWDEADLAFRVRAAGMEGGDLRVRAARRVSPRWQQHPRDALRRIQGQGAPERASVSRAMASGNPSQSRIASARRGCGRCRSKAGR